MNYFFEAVWMTTQQQGTPHAEALQAANPNLAIHVSAPALHPLATRRTGWRNCDRNIRSWWRVNRDAVMKDSVLFIEYDVYCNADLRDILRPLRPGAGIGGPEIKTCVAHRRNFWPFQDIIKLPREMQGLACATAPLAVLLITRAALDAILRPQYDTVFDADIFCETRLPTVIRHAGYDTEELPVPCVRCCPLKPPSGEIGIWHPVKYKV